MGDTLLLGPITFTDFSPPERMPWGGRQMLAVHKLLGGQRVIDVLGPDDRDVSWSGIFYGNSALGTCQALDALRSAGTALPLVWGAAALTVVISEFSPDMRRFPMLISYSITCVVSANLVQGVLGAITMGVDSLVSNDLSAMTALSS